MAEESSGQKRKLDDQDPDYDVIPERQEKRKKVLENDAKESTKRKIEQIIQAEFDKEISSKEREIHQIDSRLQYARTVMDKLRACIVASYYGKAGQTQGIHGHTGSTSSIHPQVKKHLGKTVKGAPPASAVTPQEQGVHDSMGNEHQMGAQTKPAEHNKDVGQIQPSTLKPGHHDNTQPISFRAKKRIIIGNVSKYIPFDKREANDQSTHKWMLYVRGARDEPRIDHFVKKVWFFLHPSYRPNDLVEVNLHPFHLTRRGWGEFPVRVQIHFHGDKNKCVDVIHHLTLDRTYTGLQTLGSETVIEVELEKDTAISDTSLNQNTPESCMAASGKISHPGISTGLTDHTETDSQKNIRISAQFKSEKSVEEQSLDKIVKEHFAMTMSPVATVSSAKLEVKVKPEPDLNLQKSNSTSGSQLGPDYVNVKVKSDPDQNSGTHNRMAGSQQGEPENIVSVKKAVRLVKNPEKKCDMQVKQEAGDPFWTSFGENEGSLSQKYTDIKPSVKSLKECILSGKEGVAPAHNLESSIQPPVEERIKTAPSPEPLNTAALVTTTTENAGSFSSTMAGPMGHITMATSTLGFCASTMATTMGNNVTVSMTNKCHVTEQNTHIDARTIVSSKSVTSQSDSTNTVKSSAQASTSVVTSAAHDKLAANDMVYVKCMDGYGKILLVPKSMLKFTNPTAGATSTCNKVVTTSKVTSSRPSTPQSQSGSRPGTPASASGSRPGTPGTKGQTTIIQQLSRSSTPLSQSGSGPGTSRPATPMSQSGSRPGTPKMASLLSPQQEGLNKGLTVTSIKSSHGAKIACNTAAFHGNFVGLQGKGQSQSLLKSTSLLSKPFTLKGSQDQQLGTSQGQTQSAHNTQNMINLSAGNQSVGSKPLSYFKNTATRTGQQDQPVTVSQNIPVKGKSMAASPNAPSQNTANTLTAPKAPTLLFSTVINGQTYLIHVPQQNNTTPSTIPQAGAVKTKKPESRGLVKQTAALSKQEPSLLGIRARQQKMVVSQEKLTYKPLCIRHLSTVEEMVSRAVRLHPLVDSQADRSLHPYCARSVEEFLGWNVGKRRAAEWQRASVMKQRIELALRLEKQERTTPLKVWSVKQIMLWCRHQAYSPLDPEISKYLEHQVPSEEARDQGVHRFSSYTDCDDIISDICKSWEAQQKLMMENTEVDILTLEEPKNKKKSSNKCDNINHDDRLILPPTLGSGYIQDTLAQAGIHLKLTEILPNIFGTVVEGMVMACTKLMMETLLRESFAQCWKENRYPEEIRIADVYRAIHNKPNLSFLSNSGLGKQEDAPTTFSKVTEQRDH